MNEPTDKAGAPTDRAMSLKPTSDFTVSAALTDGGVGDQLRAAGIPLTLQRLAVAQVMLVAPVHLTADQVLARARDMMPEISRGTVYNTLKLFSEKKLVREVIADGERVVFDSNTTPHYHFYEVASGEVTDVPAGEIRIVGSARLPPGTQLECVDVVVRIRRTGIQT